MPRTRKTGEKACCELVPAGWFRSELLAKFSKHKSRPYRGDLNSCIDSALKRQPLKFKYYALYKDGRVLPGVFAVADDVILIEERNERDIAGKVCFYFCEESLTLS